MRLVCISVITACFAALTPAAAETLTPTFVETVPSGYQKVWHATLDLRDLPANSRPYSVSAEIDASNVPQDSQGKLRVTISLNGIVIAQGSAEPGQTLKVTANLEDRLLSTRNRISLAVTSLSQSCTATVCDVRGAELKGPIHYSLDAATGEPIGFAGHITRFRQGIALKVADPRDRQLGQLAIQAMAPFAPIHSTGPAEIIVSRTLPGGVRAPIRLDDGMVDIKDREGRVLFDRARLDALTIVQLARLGDRPVLWVRPGTEPLGTGPLELDYGNIALFGSHGREIAFSSDRDHALTISYAANALRDAQTSLHWRLGIAAVWLVITAGFAIVLRRTMPLEPAAA